MKKILMVFALAACTTAFSQVTQNENEKTTTKVTKTTVKDSKGMDVTTKEVTTKQSQDLALTSFDGKHNFNTVMEPVQVKTDVNYSNDGVSYRFEPHSTNGFQLMTMTEDDTKPMEYAVIRPSSQKGYYLMSQNGDNSFGYFNQNGHFVVESYDPQTDSIVYTIYKLDPAETKVMKKDKM
ncbi:MAG: hypothetical protein OQJ83_12820 [Altibacter sp.]|nr:hypothetical protein [Altibacter sp.]